jgi:4-hydroxybenzoate polyprenyltransferase
MRLDKPIGIYLLAWPTLWALWLSAHGRPNIKVLFVFLAGTILMRGAGCIVNDVVDCKFDRHVERTKNRPLASHKVSVRNALLLASLLSAIAFLLVLTCNALTIFLALIGAMAAIIYPFLKRVTHLPQLGLGMAFSWGIPMAFAAETGEVGINAWILFLGSVIWPVIYDTMYAMVDREDDLKIGVKSTAILFDRMDKVWIVILQGLMLCLFVTVGFVFNLNTIFYVTLTIVALLFAYQIWLIKDRNPKQCFAAFLNNNWVGLVLFLGILVGTR